MLKTITKSGVALFFLGWTLLYSLSAAINMPTFHLDGAFQTASGLFRLDSGQFPGKDFFPYLGIGPLLSLYPAFKVFGSDLSASVFSAQFMTIVFGWLSVSIIWQLIFGPKSFITSLAAGAVFFVTPIVGASYFSLPLHHSLSFASNPGNSLRSIRAAAPYVIAITYYFLILNIKSAQIKSTLSGIITGAVLLWSNDFAIPSAGLFAIFIAFNSFIKDEFKLQNALLYVSSAFFSWAALLGLTTLGHPLDLLKYNFLDVAKDQWWFFGPYGDSTRIFELQQIFRLISQETIFPLIILALAVVAAIKTKRIEHVLVAWIGSVLLAGGILASAGGHLGGYFGGFYFWGVVTLVFAFLRLAYFGLERTAKSNTRWLFIVELASTLFAFSVLLAIAMLAWQQYKSNLDGARNDPNRFYVSELGGYLHVEWRDYINLARQTNTQHVVEEYWGLWSATRKIFPAWPVDSVIHALGRTREVATGALKDAEIIISTRNSTSPEWQPWNLSQNFWFYDELLKNWTPQELSPTTIVWHKNKTTHLHKSIECHPGNDKKSISLNIAEPGFYRVELDYGFSGRGRHLLLVKNNLSFGADAGGYVSINPGGEKALFPVYISQRGPASLDIKVVGNEQYDFKIISCASNQISFVDGEVLHVPGSINDSFFLTDNNWSRGVARNWAGFFVPNTEKSSREYRPGRFVKFVNGDLRKVIRTEPAGLYLNIFLEGNPLNPEKAGLPSSYSVGDYGASYEKVTK